MKPPRHHKHYNDLFNFLCKLPFARPKFRRSRAVLGASGNITDAQGGQGVLLFPFICQGRGAQVKNQVEAV